GKPPIGEQLEPHNDRVCRPPLPGRDEAGPKQPRARPPPPHYSDEGGRGVCHPTTPRDRRARRRAMTTPTASYVRRPATGITTKKPSSSSGRPQKRIARVCDGSDRQCPACVAATSQSTKTTNTGAIDRTSRRTCPKTPSPKNQFSGSVPSRQKASIAAYAKWRTKPGLWSPGQNAVTWARRRTSVV